MIIINLFSTICHIWPYTMFLLLYLQVYFVMTLLAALYSHSLGWAVHIYIYRSLTFNIDLAYTSDKIKQSTCH